MKKILLSVMFGLALFFTFTLDVHGFGAIPDDATSTGILRGAVTLMGGNFTAGYQGLYYSACILPSTNDCYVDSNISYSAFNYQAKMPSFSENKYYTFYYYFGFLDTNTNAVNAYLTYNSKVYKGKIIKKDLNNFLVFDGIKGSMNTSIRIDVDFDRYTNLYLGTVDSIYYEENSNYVIGGKLDELNDSISSENDDVTSNKCGMICKLKNIAVGIIELPGKIITGLLDGIKSLFIPSDDFFSNWFNELWSFLQEKLGILLLPFTLIGDILTRFLSLSSGAYIISIPAVTMPIWGGTIIPATIFDFATLTSNSVIGNMHSIYLMVVDVIIIFALVNLAKKKYEEMMSGGTSE